MECNQFQRTEMLLGKAAMDKLQNAHVAIFGLGGVGSYTVEALARSGIGHLTLVDKDRVDITNINRQLIATLETVGMLKTDAAEQRILSINPLCNVEKHSLFFTAETSNAFDFSAYTYIVDAIDTVSAKLELAQLSYNTGIPIISSMGAGNKLDPTMLQVADIYSTSMCPLARTMRRELKKRGIPSLQVVYSCEAPAKPQYEDTATRGMPPGSVAFVPSVAGLIMAGVIIRKIANL